MSGKLESLLLAGILTFVGCASGSTDQEIAAPIITHPELRAELRGLFRRDQRARKDMIAAINRAPAPPDGQPYAEEAMPAVRRVREIDIESADFLEKVIEEHGWPTISMVGQDGADAAWLIAQHADARPELQQRALQLMEVAVANGEANPAKLAYLTDRVLVSQKKPQRYGTQFGVDSDGVHRPYRIEPGEAIDLRRAKVGLPPLAFAAREWGKALGVEARPDPLD